jgi:hypothetical protein
MLTNAKLLSFVNRAASDETIKAHLTADFEGTLKAHGLELSESEIQSLKAGYRYLSNIEPIGLLDRMAAAGHSTC